MGRYDPEDGRFSPVSRSLPNDTDVANSMTTYLPPRRLDRGFPSGRPGSRPPGGPGFYGPPARPPPPGQDFRRFGGMPPEPVWYIAGLAHFRAGAMQLSNERLNPLLHSDSPFPWTRFALPVQAMAYHSLGQTAAAKTTLQAAEDALDEWCSTLQDQGLEQLPLPWFDFLECLLLYREAHELIQGQLPPEEERLTQLEQHALATLRNK